MVKLSAHASAEQLLIATSYQVERGSIFIPTCSGAHTEMIYMLHISPLFPTIVSSYFCCCPLPCLLPPLTLCAHLLFIYFSAVVDCLYLSPALCLLQTVFEEEVRSIWKK